ncbi:hypothetical protein QQP08_017006 [Theobroma cacao]|nr:hypothetical protein QQP08_016354 [Theobroma cacao]WRX24519.1 hypothetical protein QQP08_017006 [Theobroma cacao]
MRERETPRVLRPGIFSTLAPVTSDPMVLLVKPGLARPAKKKSSAPTLEGFLQGNPFTFTPVYVGTYMYLQAHNNKHQRAST